MPRIPLGRGNKTTLNINKLSKRATGADITGNLDRLQGASQRAARVTQGLSDMFTRLAIQRKQQKDLIFSNGWKQEVNKFTRESFLNEKEKTGSDAIGSRESYNKTVADKKKEFFSNVPDHLKDELQIHWDNQAAMQEFNVIRHEDRETNVAIEADRKQLIVEAMAGVRENPEASQHYEALYEEFMSDHEAVGTYSPEVAEILRLQGVNQIAGFAVEQGIKTSPNDVGPGSPPDYELRLGPKVGEFDGRIKPERIADLIALAKKERIDRKKDLQTIKNKAKRDAEKARKEEVKKETNGFYQELLSAFQLPEADQTEAVASILSDVRNSSVLSKPENAKAQFGLVKGIEGMAKDIEEANNPFINSDAAEGGSKFNEVLEEIRDPRGVRNWIDEAGNPDFGKLNDLWGKGLGWRDVNRLQEILSEEILSQPQNMRKAMAKLKRAARNNIYASTTTDPEIKAIMDKAVEDRTQQEKQRVRDFVDREAVKVYKKFNQELKDKPDLDPLELSEEIISETLQDDAKIKVDSWWKSTALFFLSRPGTRTNAELNKALLGLEPKRLDKNNPEDVAVMDMFLNQAAEDVEKAKELARESGFTFD